LKESYKLTIDLTGSNSNFLIEVQLNVA